MDHKRRIFLRGTLAASAATVAAAAGLLSPQTVLAAWPKEAFEAQDIDAAIKEISGLSGAVASDKVTVKTPDIAENGSIVSVTVQHDIPGAESISILVPENSNKLAASYNLSKQSGSFVTCRIKMRKTSDVVGIVKADGKLYSGKGRVKVTLGGCGG